MRLSRTCLSRMLVVLSVISVSSSPLKLECITGGQIKHALKMLGRCTRFGASALFKSPTSQAFRAGVSRELGASAMLLLGAMATGVTWGLLNDKITQAIDPNYFANGATARRLDGFEFELGNIRLHGHVRFDGNDVVSYVRGLRRCLDTRTIPGTLLWRVLPHLPMIVPLIHATRAGSLPKLAARDLLLPACASLGFLGLSSGLAGFAGYKLEQRRNRILANAGMPAVPEDEHNRSFAAFCARNASLVAVPVAYLGLCAGALRERFVRANVSMHT